ncbi:hypothetical protein Tco_1365947 [Tanacetum coccineum]
MEHVFLSQKGSGAGRGVKEKHSSMADKEKSGVEEKLTTLGISLYTESDDTMNEDTPVVVTFAVKEVVCHTPKISEYNGNRGRMTS